MIRFRFSIVPLLTIGTLIGVVAYQALGSIDNDGAIGSPPNDIDKNDSDKNDSDKNDSVSNDSDSDDIPAVGNAAKNGAANNGDASDGAPGTAITTSPSEKQNRALGSLRGRVTFSGKAIPPRIVQVTKDVATCKKAGDPIAEVDLSREGYLTGVVIEIQGAKPPQGDWVWNEPQEGYVLRQEHCSFRPRVLVIKNGSNVRVYNDDDVAHNVNTGQWNVMQPGGADVIDKPIRARRPIRIGCNIHSWMEAWVYPAQSPLYCVTDEKGEFQIANVPPGTYRTIAWHPALRQQRLKVTIEAGQATTRDIEFQSPLK